MPWTELADLNRTDDLKGEPDPPPDDPQVRRLQRLTARMRARKLRERINSNPRLPSLSAREYREYHEPRPQEYQE